MRSSSRLWIFVPFTLILAACTDGKPTTSALDLTFAGPTFNGKTSATRSVSSISSPITLDGECDKRLDAIEVSRDGGMTWEPPPSAGADLNCKDESFSFSMADPASYLDLTSGVAATKTLLVRGETLLGETGASEMTIKYTPVANSATISGVPVGPTSTNSATITVSGAGVTHYKYKIGLSLDCASPAGYGASPIAIATPISEDLSSLADGTVVVCVLGSDGTNWQAESAATSAIWSRDTTPPTVSITSASPTPTNANPIQLTFTFSESVTPFPAGGLSVTNGTVSGVTDTGGGLVYTANLNPGADGTVSVTFAAGTVSDSAGNTNSSGVTLNRSYDGTAPVAPSGLTLVSPASSPGSSLTPTVQATGVTSGDMVKLYNDSSCTLFNALATAAGPSVNITSASLVEGVPYTLYARSVDPSGNLSACSTASVGYIPDVSAPTATLTGTPSSPSNATSLSITVGGTGVSHYRAKVGAAGATDCLSATGYGAELAIGSTVANDISGLADGTVKVCVVGRDSAGNYQSFSSPTSATWTKDTTAPSVTVNQAVAQTADPTNGLPIQFTVVFSEPVVSLAATDISNSGTATGLTWNVSTSDNITFALSATGASADGTVVPTIAAAKSADLAGNPNSASSSTDNSVTYDSTHPTATNVTSVAGSATYGLGEDIDLTVAFDEAVTVTGNPVLTLATSPTQRNAVFVSSTGNTMTFRYTVQPGDSAADLDYVSASSLGLNGGTIADAVNNSADLTLPPPGGPNSIAGQNDIVVNTGPAVLSLSSGSMPANVPYQSIWDVSVTVTNVGQQAATSLNFSGYAAPFAHNSGTCGTTLSAGATCTFVLRYTSPGLSSTSGQYLQVDYFDGYGSATPLSLELTANGLPASVTVDAVYPTNANWNDYVRNFSSGTGQFDRDDVACNGTETSAMGALPCIHGGEKRKIVLSGTATCAGLTFSDSLGAFNWTCSSGSGTATLYMLGLKEGKGLRDLITMCSTTPCWIGNQIDVSDGAHIIYQSNSSTWWTNSLANLYDGTFSTAGTIYYYDSVAPFEVTGLNINADKVGIVTAAHTKILYHNDSTPQCNGTTGEVGTSNHVPICAGSQKFLWIESNVAGGGGSIWPDRLIYFSNVNFSRILNSYLTGSAGQGALRLKDSKFNSVRRLRITMNSVYGLYLEGTGGTENNVFSDLNVSNTSGPTGVGLLLTATGVRYNSFVGVTSTANDGEGIKLAASSSGNTFSHVTVAQNGAFISASDGIELNTVTNNTMNQLVVVNNGFNAATYGNGLNLTSTTNNQFSQIFVRDNASGGKGVKQTSASGDAFRYATIVNSCAATGAAPGLSATCMKQYSSPTTPAADTTTVLNPLAFVGKVIGDSVNVFEDGVGHANLTTLDTDDRQYANFENFFRTWGLDPSNLSFPDPSARGSCSSGPGFCQIWDWSLSTVSSALRDFNGSFTAGGACPASVSGSVYVTDLATPTNVFLANAYEVLGDSVGDEDGLCESNETCIYSPNLGAYQGHGTISFNPASACTFATGAIANVTLYAFPNNGHPTTVNFAKWNGADKAASINLSGGNLSAVYSGADSGNAAVRADIGRSGGKWYFEVHVDSVGGSGVTNSTIGIGQSLSSLANYVGSQTTSIGYDGGPSAKVYRAGTPYNTPPTYGAGNTIGVAVDLDNQMIWFSKDCAWVGTSYGTPDPVLGTGQALSATFTPGTYYPMVSLRYGAISYTANFGGTAFSCSVPAGFNSGWY